MFACVTFFPLSLFSLITRIRIARPLVRPALSLCLCWHSQSLCLCLGAQLITTSHTREKKKETIFFPCPFLLLLILFSSFLCRWVFCVLFLAPSLFFAALYFDSGWCLCVHLGRLPMTHSGSYYSVTVLESITVSLLLSLSSFPLLLLLRLLSHIVSLSPFLFFS